MPDSDPWAGAASVAAEGLSGGVSVPIARAIPEVGDLRASVLAEEHIFELEVSVDHPRSVGRRKTVARLAQETKDRAPRSTPVFEPRRERSPFDELHRQEDAPVLGDAHVIDRHDVGMGQAGHRLRFAHQTPPPPLCLVLPREDMEELQSHATVEARIERGIDCAHPPAPQLAEDQEATDLGPARELRVTNDVRRRIGPRL